MSAPGPNNGRAVADSAPPESLPTHLPRRTNLAKTSTPSTGAKTEALKGSSVKPQLAPKMPDFESTDLAPAPNPHILAAPGNYLEAAKSQSSIAGSQATQRHAAVQSKSLNSDRTPGHTERLPHTDCLLSMQQNSHCKAQISQAQEACMLSRMTHWPSLTIAL